MAMLSKRSILSHCFRLIVQRSLHISADYLCVKVKLSTVLLLSVMKTLHGRIHASRKERRPYTISTNAHSTISQNQPSNYHHYREYPVDKMRTSMENKKINKKILIPVVSSTWCCSFHICNGPKGRECQLLFNIVLY